jgi:hypothetical protein
MMWRPVRTGKITSYTEVRDTWTLDELANFNEVQDMDEDLEEEQVKRNSPKMNGGVDG